MAMMAMLRSISSDKFKKFLDNSMSCSLSSGVGAVIASSAQRSECSRQRFGSPGIGCPAKTIVRPSGSASHINSVLGFRFQTGAQHAAASGSQGLPNRVPRARAACSAAFVRSEIKPASSSATATICVSMNRPIAPGTCGESQNTGSTPLSINVRRNFVLRVRRSSLAITSLALSRRHASNALSNSGRSARLPVPISVCSAGYDPRAVLAGLVALWLGILAVSTWQLVGIWRSANRDIRECARSGESSGWASAAKVAVMFGIAHLLIFLFIDSLPQIIEVYREAFAGD